MGMGQLFACQWYIAVAQNIDTADGLAMMITYLAAAERQNDDIRYLNSVY